MNKNSIENYFAGRLAQTTSQLWAAFAFSDDAFDHVFVVPLIAYFSSEVFLKHENKCLVVTKIALVGKTIFITGATGFVGKVMMEKFLRSCPDLEKIFVLMRPKRGKTLYERLEQITSLVLFNLIKETCPENIKKIIPISGDVTQLNLGLSNDDRQILLDEVQIFFHAAASVKFDDFLKDAIFTNLRSTREAALLALEMKKIEVFMQVSTTYCNIDNREIVEPILYPPHGDWREVLTIAENCDKEILNVLSHKFIGEFPNTYTYTKQLSEHCVNDLLAGKIPAIIFRPSIVISSMVEPMPGWIDNINGPAGLLLAGATGLLRIVYGDPEISTDYVTVDNTVKCMIVAVWHKANFGNNDELEIYNGSNHNHIMTKIKMLFEMGKRLRWDVPFEKKIWIPNFTITKCWYNYFINVILFHVIPAIFLDLLIKTAGYKLSLLKIQRKIYTANMAISLFMLNEWQFINTNTMALLDSIPKKELENFDFTIKPASDQDIYNFYWFACDQGRQLLLKESKEITDKTRIMTNRMYYLDRICHWAFYGFVFWLVFFRVNILEILWNIIYNYWTNL